MVDRGLGFSVDGYSPKLPEYAVNVLKDFTNEEFWRNIDPGLVSLCKERLLRGLRSWTKERPDTLCDGFLTYLMQEGAWLPSDRLRAAEAITTESLTTRALTALRYRKVTCYVHGDMPQETGRALFDSCKDVLPPPVPAQELVDAGSSIANEMRKSEIVLGDSGEVLSRARILPPGHLVVALPTFNTEDANSALLTHIQTEATTPRVSAIMMVLRSLMAEPCFAELRTKKQLGYIVQLSSAGFGRYFNFFNISNYFHNAYLN
jgi:secreted Zn-dependent insulinase-like peptidase